MCGAHAAGARHGLPDFRIPFVVRHQASTVEHDFRVRAGAVFLLAISTAAALEALLMHASPVSRRYILTHVHGRPLHFV